MAFNTRNYPKSKLEYNTYISNIDGKVYYYSGNLYLNLPFKADYVFPSNGQFRFIDENGWPAAHFHKINKNLDITDLSTWLLPPTKLSNSEVAFIQGRGNELYLDSETDTYGPNYYMNVIVTYKNGEVYNIYNSHNKSMDPLPVPPYKTVHKVEIPNLPENELIYKVSNYRGFDGGYIITQKGNVYIIPQGSKYPTIDFEANLTKLNISNVVAIQPAHWNNEDSYFLTEDGSLYHVNGEMWNTPINKVEGLPRIRYDKDFHENEITLGIWVLGEDDKFYYVYKDNIIDVLELPEGVVPKDYQSSSCRFYLISTDNKYYEWYINPVRDKDSGEVTFDPMKIIHNAVQLTDYGSTISVGSPIPYVDLDIDHYTYTYKSTGTNVTYKHRFALHQNISNDGSRNVVNYVPNCGLHLYDKVI